MVLDTWRLLTDTLWPLARKNMEGQALGNAKIMMLLLLSVGFDAESIAKLDFTTLA